MISSEVVNFFEKESSLKLFLSKIVNLYFWDQHFFNNNFKLDAVHFTFECWKTLPIFHKSDFLKIGFRKRALDVWSGNNKSAYDFFLKSTSGTTNQTSPILILREVYIGRSKASYKKILFMQGLYSACLGGVLWNIARKKIGIDIADVLVLTPKKLSSAHERILKDFSPDKIITQPWAFSTILFLDFGGALKNVKQVSLNGDFLSGIRYEFIKKLLPQSNISISYGMAEVGGILGRSCKFLREKYGLNAYHPRMRSRFFEIVGQDTNGFGELVVTITKPIELALLRYKTGDIAKVFMDDCACGRKWVLILAGRKDFDYIKCGGALIVKNEIERVMETLAEYLDGWRGEVKEVLHQGKLMSELTVYVNLKTSVPKNTAKIVEAIKNTISKNLFLTPNETLDDLVRRGKFLPLNVVVSDVFSESDKKTPIKRILY